MKLPVLFAFALLCCPAWAGDKAYTVRATELKAKPFADAATLASLPEHSTLETLARQASWMQVKAAAGTGWVKMLSLRLGSQDAPGKSADKGKNAMFDVALTGNSGSTTTTGAKGWSNGGAKNAKPDANAESPDVIQADEIYESDEEDNTYDATVVAARMWGGTAGKLKNAHPDTKALDTISGFMPGKADAERNAKAGKLSGQVVGYLEAKPGSPANDADQSLEIALGRSIAANVLGGAPLAQNKKLQQYVGSVGLWLAMQTERPDLPWQFAVLEDEEIYAFSTPGGNIFITRGLLKRVHSEEELAGILAHEIAHVVKKHHFWAIKKRAGTTLIAAVADELTQKAAEKPVLAKLTGFGTDLYAQGLKVESEFEVDSMAVVIAARAGYDPYGLPAVLQSLQAVNLHDPNLALMLKTYPSLSDRLDALEKAMTGAFAHVEAQPNLSGRFKAAMGDHSGQPSQR